MQNVYLVIALFIVMISGVSYMEAQIINEPRPENYLDQEFENFYDPTESGESSYQSLQVDEPQDILTLQQALALALLHNPELAAYSIEIRAKEAESA